MLNDPLDQCCDDEWDAELIASVDMTPVVEAFPALRFFPEIVATVGTNLVIDYLNAYGSPDGLQECLEQPEGSISVAGTVYAILSGNPTQGKDNHGC